MLAMKSLLLWSLWIAEGLSIPAQVPMEAPPADARRKLHGRFLHITDIHPDPHYIVDASQSSACHRRKPKKEKERSGYYGAPYRSGLCIAVLRASPICIHSDCDSPFRLTNLTLDFLDKNWASEIDFVIWTGDNARHDNDRKLPRTLKEIYDLNHVIATKMEDVFLKKGVPVVPSLGNNDVWRPNDIISHFSSLWSAFVPFASYQVFRRGAYYSVEVIPGQVAVISLNTMFFYDSNKAVGGCEWPDREDPGNLQFDWLDVQLDLFRSRGMKVYLTGHVPPSPGNYFEECYVRYVELSLRYQDTILGHLYGHMNNDHFFLLEADDLQFPSETDLDEKTSMAHDQLYETLIRDFADLPKNSKSTEYDDFGVVNVAPSVVPNPYLPSFRIFSYNVTNAEKIQDEANLTKKKDKKKKKKGSKEPKRKHGHRHGNSSRETLCKQHEYEDSWRCKLWEPWNSDADAPSRRNTLWTPLGYAQYYLPEERVMNKTRRPKFKLEYLTYRLDALHPAKAEMDSFAVDGFAYPVPVRQLPRSLRAGNATKSRYAPYGLGDLTIPSWLGLARKLGDASRGKLRRRFREYMYMGAGTAGPGVSEEI
ncbi:endopolyphosphatase [Artomyces pyxidatus]|uniref:Endopolyphosphatase n=1 Tax=Artomyces pyxidatus TaxID=48021 RepID=A0ACB8TKD5_9AGAM|nr:endopolyphosphatase [Artomyces pyxidatus]